MEALKGLDAVAYVRFASVYRAFREAADFHEVLGEIAEGAAQGTPAGRPSPLGGAPGGVATRSESGEAGERKH
jgi:transcriptional repressor NrdR